MTKHPVKTIITLAATLLIGLCLGALICYGTIGTDTPVPGQSQATPRKGTAMQHANQQEPTFAKPGHTGKGTRKVFLNASQNAEGNTSSLAKELMGGEDYRQINLSEYRIPQVGQGDGDFPKVWDQLKGADVIVIGTPVYWSNMSGYLKTFIDHVEVNEDLKGADVHLTLGLRGSDRLGALKGNPRVTLAEVDLEDRAAVEKVMRGQEMMFVDTVDHDQDNAKTRNVIAAMKSNHVDRVIFANVAGIYDEVPGEFGRWNKEMAGKGLPTAAGSDRLLRESGLTYTTLRLCWLTDRDEIRYSTTTSKEPFEGVSGSRKSVADLVLRIVKDPGLGAKESLGIADPTTQGANRPVY